HEAPSPAGESGGRQRLRTREPAGHRRAATHPVEPCGHRNLRRQTRVARRIPQAGAGIRDRWTAARPDSAVDLQGPRPRPVRAAAGASGNAGRRDAPSGRAHTAGLERGGCAVLGRVPVAALTARRGWETVASGFAGVLPVTLHPGSSALRPALPLTPI